jgi:hypothetical protein
MSDPKPKNQVRSADGRGSIVYQQLSHYIAKAIAYASLLILALVSYFQLSLCATSAFSVPLWLVFTADLFNHSDTENTEVAQRKSEIKTQSI